MSAHRTSRVNALDFNHLRRGVTYRATTQAGTAVGEYLGMEALYGDRVNCLVGHRPSVTASRAGTQPTPEAAA